MTEKRDFKGVWIPKEIWLDYKMTWMEKLLITEINSLDNENGCFASNNYFARFFYLSPGRISQIINSLKKKGYLSAEMVWNGKEIEKRVLRILNTPIKNTKEGIKDIKQEYLENDKDNNTSFNNTTNILIPILEYWNKKETTQHHKETTAILNIKPKHVKIIKDAENSLFEAIDNYDKIGQEPEKYFRYKWSLWDFLMNYYKFVNEAEPFIKYISREQEKDEGFAVENIMKRLREEGKL